MSAPFVAEIRIFACNFAPTGWAMCNGQLLPISQNTALFSLVGTFYGGDGKSTFALPNLEASAPLGQGLSNASGTEFFLGQQSGVESVTLLQTEMPIHLHALNAAPDPGEDPAPDPQEALGRSVGAQLYQTTTNANLVPLDFQAAAVTGSSFPHNNMQPYLTLNFCIAMQGVFPPRG